MINSSGLWPFLERRKEAVTNDVILSECPLVLERAQYFDRLKQ